MSLKVLNKQCDDCGRRITVPTGRSDELAGRILPPVGAGGMTFTAQFELKKVVLCSRCMISALKRVIVALEREQVYMQQEDGSFARIK